MRQYANLGTRLACHISDLIVIQAIVLPVAAILERTGTSAEPLSLEAYQFLTLIIWGIYSSIMNALSGKGTIGKRMMGVKVEKENGDKLNILQSAVRFFTGFILFGLFIGMIPILFNKKKKGLHDMLVGSVVRYR